MTLSFFHLGKAFASVADVTKPMPVAATHPLKATVDVVAEKVVAAIRAELPELLLVAVVDTMTGQDMASYTSMSSFDPHTAASFNAEIIKQKKRALHAFHLDDEQIEDIIISTTSQHHIIKAINNGQKFIYLAVLEHTTSLGFVREVLRRHALSLVD